MIFEKTRYLFYILIYSLELPKIKIQKTYIKTNLANCFINLLKLSASAVISFVSKSNNSYFLSVNYLEIDNPKFKT